MVEMGIELSISEELMVPVPFRAFPSIKVQWRVSMHISLCFFFNKSIPAF